MKQITIEVNGFLTLEVPDNFQTTNLDLPIHISLVSDDSDTEMKLLNTVSSDIVSQELSSEVHI
jgi:hypothetical protein